jgi:hypothetical protein
MTRKGTYVGVGVRPGGRWVGPLSGLLKVLVSSWFVSQNVVFLVARVNTEDLVALKQLVEANVVITVGETT